MIQTVYADIIPLLHFTVKALQPYISAQEIELELSVPSKKMMVHHDPRQIMEIVSGLTCHIVNYLSAGGRIEISLHQQNESILLQISNSGVDLSRVLEITARLKAKVEVIGTGSGTLFQFLIPEIREVEKEKETEDEREKEKTSSYWRSCYAIIRKRLKWHFSKADNLVDHVSHHHPADLAFLKHVNAIIFSNIENENFDTTSLCREMSMSRTQLFRKLKPLIRQAPAHYIRSLRLQKAKELLETSGLNVCEVTYKTGFQSQSHFTKAFTRQYGKAPSLVKKAVMQQNDKNLQQTGKGIGPDSK